MEYPLWRDRNRVKFALIFNRKPLINYFIMYGGVLSAAYEIGNMVEYFTTA